MFKKLFDLSKEICNNMNGYISFQMILDYYNILPDNDNMYHFSKGEIIVLYKKYIYEKYDVYVHENNGLSK